MLEGSHGANASPVFTCTKCGLCCKNLDKSAAYAHLNRGDGTCVNFDSTTSECSIYTRRPLICRVDDFYEHNLSAHMSKEAYIAGNLKACIGIQTSNKINAHSNDQEGF
ncbi:YkgJ family cysteine cluster protein [Pseudomonas putida]|uniref:YkgJ family cysteine cluster protein n=1 Tax=Pseudomonas putida TaxID=303 RepID=UPI0009BCA5B0|nr:YkgJ family cysteine cluster protein [Pseudomonas putida]